MSYSTLYKIYRTRATPIKEYKNGFGSGPAIWGYLAEKYLNVDCWLTMKPVQPLWDLAKDRRVPEHLRLIHAFCFDGAVMPVEHFEDAGKQFRAGALMIQGWAPNHVNHWAEIGEDLIKLAGTKDKQLLGIGFNCTSVSSTWPRKPEDTFNCYEYVKIQPENPS